MGVATVAVRGTWLKQTYAGSLALPEREPAPDNAWRQSSVVDALYLADGERRSGPIDTGTWPSA